MHRGFAIAGGLLVAMMSVRAADQLWQPLDHVPLAMQQLRPWIRPPNARPFRLRTDDLQRVLTQPAEIALPMPDGSLARFRVIESPVMAPELVAKFPRIKTYLGQGIDDPSATVRFDWTPAGFHAQILSPRGAVYVDPYSDGDVETYTSYYKRDYRRAAAGFVCLTKSADLAAQPAAAVEALSSGATLRTYRLACAATGEYTEFHGGTVEAGLAAIVTAINRVTGILEVEVAVRLQLVGNNDQIVYTNPATDPYSNNNPSTMLNQNQSNLDNVIGIANYDIGHVFGTAGGGIAVLGAACVTSLKAQGATGISNPVGDPFAVDYVAHEIGHQFDANHTFNSTTGGCSGNRNGSTAYEPGSGSTIMAYSGLCDSDNIQTDADPYYLHSSYDEIVSFTTAGSGSGCPATTATGNTAPTVNAGPDYVIPQNTPFTLTATGNDPDGDPFTYCWELRDLGPAQTLADPDNGSSPLFRTFNPTNHPSRTFPKLSAILNNTSSLGEKLPTTSRTLHFRVTVRDHRAGGGGVNTDDMAVTVNASAGPFRVTFPNATATLSGLQTITWSVAGTATHASHVNIRLATDGGQDFPIILAANTPNDGSQTIVLPNLNTATARVKVEAVGNIFFDISDANFTIEPGIPTPLIVGAGSALTTETCGPANTAIDPDETVTVAFALQNIGTLDTTNLVGTLLPTGGVSFPSAPQNFGALIAGVAAVSRPFTFTASGTCGGTITAVLQLQDGAVDLGTVTNVLTLGDASAGVASSTNAAAIAIPASGNNGPAGPYPASITVAGLSGAITKVTVTLHQLSHTRPDDLDILLVGPTGQSVLLMSDAGGSPDAVNLTLTFDDDAPAAPPDSGGLAAGTFRPVNYGSPDSFLAPAPAGPYGATLATFVGTDPNGAWSLYVLDDASPSAGSLAGGWSLTIASATITCCEDSNQPPVINAATISPAAPTTTNDLVATVTDANDPDNDPITFAWQWQESTDGAAFSELAFNTDTLPATATVSGNHYRAVITPNDGQIDGLPFTTAAVQVPADSDGDELNDDWEIVHFGSLAATADADPDGDWWTNAQEQAAGTDPNDQTSALHITAIESLNGDLVLSFTTVAGKSYRAEYSDDLPADTWTTFADDIPGTGSIVQVTDPSPAPEVRQYRVVLLP